MLIPAKSADSTQKVTNNTSRSVYLDYAAATPLDPVVLASMLPHLHHEHGNPSSIHKSGRRAKDAIEKAREDTALILGAPPNTIVFTGSGTESANLAILGIAKAHRSHGKHIIISAIEHNAVLGAAAALGDEGFEVTTLPVDKNGLVDPKECLEAVRNDTTLVSIMYANNEIGTIQPVREIVESIKTRYPDISIHTDACQAGGQLPLNVKDLGVDLMTLNGSKIYGPKGVGMLYIKEGTGISPVILGGEQEFGLRAGTENTPLIVGFAEALSRAENMRESETERLTELRDYFINRIEKSIPSVMLNGHRIRRLSNNVHISVPRIEGESILLMLDEVGIEASTGSACTSRTLKPSHVLTALGQSSEMMHGSIRLTLGRYTTKTDIDYVLESLPPIIKRLRAISSIRI